MLNNNIDDISLKIISLLQENSRISYVDIGKAVNLSTSSVIERIKKMEEGGLINRYTVDISPKSFGLNITAIMTVSISGVLGFQKDAFVNSVLKLPNVIECLRITGNYDFLIKVIASSIEDLKIVNDEVGKFGQVNTSIVVSDFIENKHLDINKVVEILGSQNP